VFVFLLASLAFLRGTNVGTDVQGYTVNFIKMTTHPRTWNEIVIFDVGFNYIVAYFKEYISSNPMFCWGLMGIFYTCSFYRYAKKYVAKNLNIALMLFVLLGGYFLSFNIMRQCFAASLMLLLYSFFDIQNLSKINRYCLLTLNLLLGYLFHPAICVLLVVFLFPALVKLYVYNKRTLIILILISFIICASKIILNTVMDFVNNMGLEGKLINYATRNASAEVDSGFSILKLIFISMAQIYVIAFSRDIKNIFIFLSTFAVVFLNLFGILVIEFARIYELLYLFGLPSFVLLCQDSRSRKKYYMNLMIVIIYGSITYWNILLKNYGGIVPYSLNI
jgi:hypothetical protein